MNLNVDTLEKEREFYYNKLRDIELYLQFNPDSSNEVTENIFKILYASEEEKVTVQENGEIIISGGVQEENGDEQLMQEEEEEKLE